MKIGDKVIKMTNRYGENNGNSIYTVTNIYGPIYEITTIPDEFNQQSTKVYYENINNLEPYVDISIDEEYFKGDLYFNGDTIIVKCKENNDIKDYYIVRNGIPVRIHFCQHRLFGKYKFSKNDEVYILPSALNSVTVNNDGTIRYFNNHYCYTDNIPNVNLRHVKDYYGITKGKIVREIFNSHYIVMTENGPLVYSIEQLRLTKKYVPKPKVLSGNFLDKTTNKSVKFVSSTIVSSIVFCTVVDLETSKEYKTNLKNLKKIKDV